METNELVKLAQKGDAEAFGQLYDLFAQKIFRYISLKVQDSADAEDVLQDVFIKAYKGLPKLNLENLNFSAWLYKVTSNAINDRFRKKYRTPEITPIDEDFDIASSISVETEVGVKMEMEQVEIVFNKLSPLHKQVLELRFIQGFGLEEIAKILNKSNLSIRLLQFRALKMVKKHLAQESKE